MLYRKLIENLIITSLLILSTSITLAESITLMLPEINIISQDIKAEQIKKATLAFELAGYDVNVLEVPFARILHVLKTNPTMVCTRGLTYTKERSKFLQYSQSIITSPSSLLMINKKRQQQFSNFNTLASLLKDKKMVLGNIIGLSNGAIWDDKIKKHNTPVRLVTSYNQLIKMLNKDRIQYVYVMGKVDDLYFEQNNISKLNLTYISFPDMPPPLERFIACSKSTPKNVMDNINQVLSKDKLNTLR